MTFIAWKRFKLMPERSLVCLTPRTKALSLFEDRTQRARMCVVAVSCKALLQRFHKAAVHNYSTVNTLPQTSSPLPAQRAGCFLCSA